MKTKIIAAVLVVLAVVGMLILTSCKSNPEGPAPLADAPNAPGATPARVNVKTITTSFTVLAVDPATRTVTLQNEGGAISKYKCGKEVANFDQIKVGDHVNASVIERLAIFVRKAAAPANVGEGSTVALTPLGAKPGVIVADTAEITDKVVAVDAAKFTVTLKGLEGQPRTYDVDPAVDLSNASAGDDVVIRYTEAIAMLVEAPPTSSAPAAPTAAAPAALTPDEARLIATEAYIYGYPLVTMEYTRRVMTNEAAVKGTRGPMGQLIRLRQYPDAKFRDVTAPNADTLYTTVWLDVAKEPWVLEIPDSKGRYYLMPMLDGWTTVFDVPGTRTTGNGPQKYLITGPKWQGTVPDGLTQYKSPTGIVWILGRIYCTGTPEDYAATHAMQDKVATYPLSAMGKQYTPPAGTVDPSMDMKTPVREQVNALDASSYFDLLAKLMVDNPPVAADAPIVAKMARIGIVPGKKFDPEQFGPSVAAAFKGVPKAAFGEIMAYFKKAGAPKNGWLFSTHTGLYGTDYVNRALVTAIGLGANRPQDAVYPVSEADIDGKPYDGANKYVMHFAKGQMPPANAFWSLTMYDSSYFFVQNPLNRYNVSSRSKFVENADGSVDVYIQHDSPGAGKEANWLPAPAGKFILMLRLYYPRETPPSILDGSWVVPPVKKAN